MFRKRTLRPSGILDYPGDIVGIALYLASLASAFVTSQIIVVDSGRVFNYSGLNSTFCYMTNFKRLIENVGWLPIDAD